jgi:hypothetical protein
MMEENSNSPIDQNENDTNQLINDENQIVEKSHSTTNVETLMHIFKGK